MKQIIIILLIAFFSGNSFCQENENRKKFGVGIGYGYSTLFDQQGDQDNSYLERTDFNITGISLDKPSICVSFIYDFNIRNRFGICPEVTLLFKNDRIDYIQHLGNKWGSHSELTANYNLNETVLQLSESFKLYFGKNFKYFTGLGPVINISLNSHCKGTLTEKGVSITQNGPIVVDNVYYDDDIEYKINMNRTGIYCLAGTDVQSKHGLFKIFISSSFFPTYEINKNNLRNSICTLGLIYETN